MGCCYSPNYSLSAVLARCSVRLRRPGSLPLACRGVLGNKYWGTLNAAHAALYVALLQFPVETGRSMLGYLNFV